MARALVCFDREPDRSWKPVTVYLATPERLEGRTMPGDAEREAWVARVVAEAIPPRIRGEERGTFEDWIEWALNAFANGADTWAVEMPPTATVDELYERHVLSFVRATEPGDPPDTKGPDVAADEGSAAAYRVEAAERDDGLLRRWLPAERPAGFDVLSREEQAWRGRLFLMTWAFTGSAVYAWAASGVTDPVEIVESKELVAGISDERIEQELIGTADQRGTAIFVTLGEPEGGPGLE